MSKQRCILILLGLLASIPILALDGFYVKTSVFGVLSSPKGILTQNRMGWEGKLNPNTTLLLDSDLRWGDVLLQDDPQKAWHSGSARIDWQNGPFAVSAAYRNILFGSSAKLQLCRQWDPLTEFERNIQHQTTLAANWNETISIYGMHKHLRTTPYTFDFNTMQSVAGEEQGLDDVYAGIGAAWKASEHWKLLLGADYKDAHFAPDNQYQATTLKASAEGQYIISSSSQVTGSLTVEHREGDFADTQRSNVLRTRIRLQHRIINDLSAMLVWENNSCFDNRFAALRLMSNYFRAQAVFNLWYDTTASSYLLGGVKISPEHDASAVFAEAECLLDFDVYAGAGVQYAGAGVQHTFERRTTYRASLTYRFMQNQDLRLVFNRVRVHFSNTTLYTDYLGLSTGFWW